MTTELIAETLNAHHISTDWFRRRQGWSWWCSCETDGEQVHDSWEAAYAAGARHQAERVADIRPSGSPTHWPPPRWVPILSRTQEPSRPSRICG